VFFLSRLPKGFRRGALLLTGARARREMSRGAGASQDLIRIAGVAIPPLDETKHFKVIGTTGTGKSTAIRQLLRVALARGDRAIIADPNGSYLLEFRDRLRGDIVLNPFEEASADWSPFAEIQERYDVEQLVSGLIPGGDDSSGREWRGYARTFVAAVVRRCHEAGRRDTGELWRLLFIAPNEEIRSLVAGSPAQPFLEPENVRMFGSIRAVAASSLAAFEYLQQPRERPFSVRRWVQRGQGALFLPYRAGQVAALRSIIAAWMRLAIYEAMQGREVDRRLWFIVDELDALGAIEGLKDALARLRKFGGRCVLGFQSVAQVSSLYGQGDAQAIIENCGNTLILRCSSSEKGGTAQFASRLIGEREVMRRHVSRGKDRRGLFSSESVRHSINTSEQPVTETAVLSSELEQLPDLAGYLKTASSPAWIRVVLTR
jgi:type IV secretory pathway TraG/TraD family ATPase VirD4